MHCSTVARRRRLPAVLASIVLLAASAGAIAPAHAANQPPTISGNPAAWVYVGSQYSFRPSAADPEGKTLRFSISGKPAWASFSTSTGRLVGTPGGVGYWSGVKISVSDGVTTRSLAFSIRAVSPNNVAPKISGLPATSASVGVAYRFKPTATDSNGDRLFFSITNRPSWASFNTNTGVLSGTPASSHVGVYSNITIRATDGRKSAYLPAFAITVKGAASANTAPVISGTPASSINAGSAYSFRPTASDANGDTLTFSIANRPAWASFNTSTGRLSGTPTSVHVGAYSNIAISVSDGKARTTLSAFSITVVDVSSGSATLSWTLPTQNTDGSTLTNLAGYRIQYGASADLLIHSIQIANPSLSTYVIENLAPGAYYFAVRAYTSSGAESANSNIASKIVQ